MLSIPEGDKGVQLSTLHPEQAYFGNYGQCAYAAAKEGIRGLTRVAATEWAADGINVNIVLSARMDSTA